MASRSGNSPASSGRPARSGHTRRTTRSTTVPRWFAVLAAVYGSLLTFLAVAFYLGASTSKTHTAAALVDGVGRWWPSAVLAAALMASLLVGFGAAASRTRRSRADGRINVS
ncbi:hypothetical protein ABLE92_23125 [Gordonia sp. VNQ95]|uniref:hypothetical protein n=1 Tax=Gordonia TaxID=2053 RepID=UPI0032B3B293